MAHPSLRDRFFTPPVAHAVTSPLGILLAGAGVAAGIVVGLPLVGAAAVGAVAYAARVAVAIPRGREDWSINPFALQDPWRTYVWQAKRAQRQFDEAVRHTKDGPLRDRLHEIGDRIATGVEECWHVAQSGQAIAEARAKVDVTEITRELSALPHGGALDTNPALAQTAAALQNQLATAKRMDEVITSSGDRLRLLDAQLGELVTRVLELTARPQGTEELAALGADVESIVGEMEALRVALDETDALGATHRPGSAPGLPASAAPPLPAAGPVAAPETGPAAGTAPGSPPPPGSPAPPATQPGQEPGTAAPGSA